MFNISVVKEYASTAQAILTSIAIVVGGAWAYMEFVRERPDKGRLTVSQVAKDFAVSDGQRFVQAQITLKNVGATRVGITKGETVIRQILPLNDNLKQVIEGNDPAAKARMNSTQTIKWPIICSGRISRSQNVSLEPDEQITLVQDFLLPRHVRLVRIYSVFEGALDDSDRSGRWVDSILHPLNDEQEASSDAQVPNTNGGFMCRDDVQRD
ncbi:MAG TPA: hypothetical protein VN112_10485 [Ensifer sp.]|nr:hypothetical protein [Ensifer sp.]